MRHPRVVVVALATIAVGVWLALITTLIFMTRYQ